MLRMGSYETARSTGRDVTAGADPAEDPGALRGVCLPLQAGVPAVRQARASDADALNSFSARCSTPADLLVAPPGPPRAGGGDPDSTPACLASPLDEVWLLAEVGDTVMGTAVLVACADLGLYHLGLTVDDAWEAHLAGSLLLGRAAHMAAGRGGERMMLRIPRSDTRVLSAIDGAGMRAWVRADQDVDDLLDVVVPLARLRKDLPREAVNSFPSPRQLSRRNVRGITYRQVVLPSEC